MFFPVLIFLTFVLVAIISVCVPHIYMRISVPRPSHRCTKCSDPPCGVKCRKEWPWSRKDCSLFFSCSSSGSRSYHRLRSSGGDPNDFGTETEQIISKESGYGATTVQEVDTSASVNGTGEDKLVLPFMWKEDDTNLRKQYSIYSWNTVTFGIFYALPALQLVLSEQQLLTTSGNQDKCYFDFKCSRPVGMLSAFNNVWSNLGYVLLGILFLIIVSIRKRMYLKRLEKNREYMKKHGIPQYHGVYQAMGVALILEGIMSAFYHICPTDANFQFDTTFMYITGGLYIVKLLQKRHPDINTNAFIAFFSFAVVIFMTLVGIYFDRRNPVVVRVTIFMFVAVVVVIFFFSFYNFHSWKLESLQRGFRRFFLQKRGPHYVGRFIKLVVILLINLILVVVVIVVHSIDFPTAVLTFFMVNLILFQVIYLFQKFYYSETFTVLSLLLFLVAIILFGFAFYFFSIKETRDWHLTPAESRAKNEPCFLLGFYDYHDVWHFLSASAMFTSFLFLLTLDDGLKDTRHDEIHIF